MNVILPSVDWSEFEHAYDVATDIPERWRHFLEHGDEDGEFSNAVCHQGTVYSATRELLPTLIQFARSASPHQHFALGILACVLGGVGSLGYKERLSKMSPRPNPFKKGEMMTFAAPDPVALAREQDWVRQMKSSIEAHLEDWETILRDSPSPRTYQSLAFLFKNYDQHSESERLHGLAAEMMTYMESYDWRLSLGRE